VAVKIYKPTSAGRRQMSVVDFADVAKKRPERSLVAGRKGQSGGRNAHGHVTSWHRGGGHKRLYRTIDFTRDKLGIPARVAAIEYDPNRSAYIALLHYKDGEKRYILAPLGLSVGDEVTSGASAEIRVGNALPLANIPIGSVIHALEMKPGKGAQLVRSAGVGAQLMAR
jgi:large subunit ribosomal protein L2